MTDAGFNLHHSPAGLSPWSIAWYKLRRKKAAMVSLYVLIALYAGALLAGFLSPYGYSHGNDLGQFHPPMLTSVHLFDEDGRLSRPFVYGTAKSSASAGESRYSEDRSRTYPVKLFVRGDSYTLLWVIRSDVHLFGVDQPGVFYLFG